MSWLLPDDQRVRPKPGQTLVGGGGGSAAAAASAAVSGTSNALPGAAQSTSALPYEGIYQEKQALANRAWEQAQQQIAAKRSGVFRQFGFNPDGGVDGNNLIGLYQQVRRRQAQSLQGAEDNRIARGLSGRGLGAQAENDLRYDHEVQMSDLMRDYQGQLSGLDQQLLGASQDRQNALLDARNAQLEFALSNGLFTPAAEPEQQPSSAAQKLAAAILATPKKPAPKKKPTAVRPIGAVKPILMP